MKILLPYHSFRLRRYRQQLERKAQQIANDTIEQSHQKSLQESQMLIKLITALTLVHYRERAAQAITDNTSE